MPQLSLHSPVGDLTLSEEKNQIVALDWGWGRDQATTPMLIAARDQLHAYFDGELGQFDLDMAPFGTPYRQAVWRALMAIPVGETRSYAELAAIAGGSARSIGGAMANNPIPIFIPCHRVVATVGKQGYSSPSLGGYSGGDGPTTKRFLLALEQRIAPLAFTHQPRLEHI